MFCIIKLFDPAKVAPSDRMVSWSNRCGSCTTSTLLPRICHKKNAIQRQIEDMDWQIDRLVYELYGLAEEEVGIVEAATR